MTNTWLGSSYDSDTQVWDTIENAENLQAAQGAGIQSSETLVRHGVTALLAPHCGPKAFRVLQAAGVAVYLGVTGTATEALIAYQEGKLQPAASADVDGHW